MEEPKEAYEALERAAIKALKQGIPVETVLHSMIRGAYVAGWAAGRMESEGTTPQEVADAMLTKAKGGS